MRSSSSMDQSFTESRIAACKARIVALEAAFLAVSSGNVASYTLDTGQTREVVTKKSLGVLQRTLDAELNLLVVLEARIIGAAGQGRPGW